MSANSKNAGPLVIGGEPRIDFLPVEIKERKKSRRARRSLIAWVRLVRGTIRAPPVTQANSPHDAPNSSSATMSVVVIRFPSWSGPRPAATRAVAAVMNTRQCLSLKWGAGRL